MAMIAKRRRFCMFAAAPFHHLFFIDFYKQGDKGCCLVGTVAKGLFRALSAGTPVIGSGLRFKLDGSKSCDNRFFFHRFFWLNKFPYLWLSILFLDPKQYPNIIFFRGYASSACHQSVNKSEIFRTLITFHVVR